MGATIASIASALISAAAAIIVCIINNNNQHQKLLTELQKRDELQAYRIEQLEKKVDKHNSVIDRTYKLEQAVSLQEEQIKVANHRIADIVGKK